MTTFFWLLAIATAYSYCIYPLLLWLLVHVHRNPDEGATGDRGPTLPAVSLIIAAHNEEKRIGAKIRNSLAIDYPAGLLEIIVASDCSTDGTDAIAMEHASSGVRVVRTQERLGKEHAQLTALRSAGGDILVFSDTATDIPPDAIRTLVRYFRNPGIGAVSSEDRFISENGTLAGEGAYVRYEMWLRRMESRAAGLVGLSGSFFAARKKICERWDIHSPSDFNTALNCARAGLRAVAAPDVHGLYRDIKDSKREYQRKVRTVLRGMTAIVRHPDVLNPFRFGTFAWQVWSHKIMRWLVPVFLLALLPVTALLASHHWIYACALAAQLLLYAVACAAHFVPWLRARQLTRLVYYFIQVNVGIGEALFRLAVGQRMSTWQPSAR